MKKIFCILMSVLVMGTTAMAQVQRGNPQSAAVTGPKASDPQQAPASGAARNADAAPKLKKDGTPDMRHKANKEAAAKDAPAQKLKKDGTPDMRHKANKDAAAPKKI